MSLLAYVKTQKVVPKFCVFRIIGNFQRQTLVDIVKTKMATFSKEVGVSQELQSVLTVR